MYRAWNINYKLHTTSYTLRNIQYALPTHIKNKMTFVNQCTKYELIDKLCMNYKIYNITYTIQTTHSTLQHTQTTLYNANYTT